MKKLIILASMVLTQAAHAELATCHTADGRENVKASDAVLVVSDASILPGNKTTARFTPANGTLTVNPSSEGTTYVGDVDLRFNDTSVQGRNIFGTKLADIDTIEVTIYSGDRAGEGHVLVNKRNGAKLNAELVCE